MFTGHKAVVRGVVIGKSAVGEGSVRVHLYTDAFGLVYVLAQSAREERSQLRAHIERGTRGAFSLVKGKHSWRLVGVLHTENVYFTLQETPDAQAAFERVIGFVRQFVRGEGSDPYFFGAFWNFIELLPALSLREIRAAEHIAVLRMLAVLGYVDDTPLLTPFLNLPYEAPLLAQAEKACGQLLKVINEGITASGLT